MSSIAIRLTAQSTAAPGPAEAKAPQEEEVIVLSPFEVTSEGDYGYTAASSLSGGRLSTDLKDTAAAVSVLTRELLDDIGALNTQEALLYATNSIAASDTDVDPGAGAGAQGTGNGSTAGGGNSLRVRGIRDATATLDYFTTSFNADSYNTERIDISRGPNAMLFGDSSTGGTFNVGTKRALSRTLTRLNLQTSSFGGMRMALDINRALTKSVALRFNALEQHLQGFKDFSENNRRGAAVAGSWRISDAAELRIQGEWGRIRTITPTNFMRDNVGGWDHLTTIKTLGQAVTTAQGLAANTNNLAFNTAHPELGLYLLNGTRRTIQTANSAGLPISMELPVPAMGLPFPLTATTPIDAPALLNGVKAFPVIPSYSYASRANAFRSDQDYYAATLAFSKRWTRKLFTEVAAHAEEMKRINYPTLGNVVYYDPNEILPAGVTYNGSNANPDFLKPYVQDAMRIQASYPRSREVRATTAYLLDTRWFNQRIGAVFSHRLASGDLMTSRIVRIDNTATPALNNVVNQVVFRTNLDQRDRGALDYDLDGTYDINGTKVAFRTFTGSGAASAVESRLTSYQLFSAGSWLSSRRIYTTLGIRRDYYHQDSFNTIVRNPVTTEIIRLDPSGSESNRVDSPSTGVVVHVLPQLSLYASGSQSFVPASGGGRLSFLGTPLPLREGRGRDYGIKFSLFDGRVTGSLGYYDTREVNNQLQPTVIMNAVSTIATTLAAFNETNLDTLFDVQTASAHGYELDLTANLTKNWALIINGGLPESTLSDALPYARQYLAANRDRWISEANQLVASGSNPNARTTVDNSIAAYEGNFASFADGLPVTNVRNYTANIFTRYRFSQGRLRGLGLGLGAHFYGKNYVQVVNNTNVYTEPYHLIDALLSYERKLFDCHVRFQVNVTNLLDDLNFQYVNYFNVTTVNNGWPNNYRVSLPREFRFTMDVNF